MREQTDRKSDSHRSSQCPVHVAAKPGSRRGRQAAVTLGRQSLDAEQKKLNLGASTSTLVLQNQSVLATAESTLVSAMAAYEKSRVD